MTDSHILRAGLYHCSVHGRHVFLDLTNDRYFLLSEACAIDFSAFLSGEATPKMLDGLERRSIVVKKPTDLQDQFTVVPGAAQCPMPTASLYEKEVGSPSIWLVGQLLGLRLNTRRQLRNVGLSAVVGGMLGSPLRRSQTVATARDRRHVSRVVAAERTVAKIIDRCDRCLEIGLAVGSMLRRRSVPFHFVIGVDLPFRAHCWIESSDMVVTDRLDRVLAYTPILRI